MYSDRPVPAAGGRSYVPVGSFPWGQPLSDRSFVALAVEGRVRCAFLCPMAGPQGVHEVVGHAQYSEVLLHYRRVRGDWVQDLVPVWPSPRAGVSASSCVMGTPFVRFWSVALDALFPMVRYLIGWDLHQVRLFRACFAQR